MMNRPVGLLLGLGLTFYAGSAFAQNEKVSLNRQNAKTIQVLNDIEKQTNYLFVYDKKNVDTNRAISINASNQTVASVLQQLFAGTGVTYEMEGNNIVLTRQTATNASTQQ
ncbi:MAG: STN domain-containing protein, partial [Parabacteroides sp.]|nr:STN domain-containing protein [Parabacteroides sp.]